MWVHEIVWVHVMHVHASNACLFTLVHVVHAVNVHARDSASAIKTPPCTLSQHAGEACEGITHAVHS